MGKKHKTALIKRSDYAGLFSFFIVCVVFVSLFGPLGKSILLAFGLALDIVGAFFIAGGLTNPYEEPEPILGGVNSTCSRGMHRHTIQVVSTLHSGAIQTDYKGIHKHSGNDLSNPRYLEWKEILIKNTKVGLVYFLIPGFLAQIAASISGHIISVLQSFVATSEPSSHSIFIILNDLILV